MDRWWGIRSVCDTVAGFHGLNLLFVNSGTFRLYPAGDIILSYVFAIGVVVMIPLLCYFFRYLLPEKELRLEVHFLVSLFVCIIGLLTTVNGNVTYQAVKEPIVSGVSSLISLFICLSFFRLVMY